MEFTDVKSSNIKSIGYDKDTQVMGILFSGSGATFHYPDVPEETFQQFLDAPSAGKFFHSEINGKFVGERQ